MKLYTNNAVDKVVKQYIDKGGDIEVYAEGSLASYGLAICSGNGLKFCIIKEKYINSWSIGNVIKFYNKLPKKYQTLTPIKK
jgi:hypothetical protein